MCTGNKSVESASRCQGSCAGPNAPKLPATDPAEQFGRCHGDGESPERASEQPEPARG